jgi:hypothetical protein
MLLRANYLLGDDLKKHDFTGENAEREFAQWLEGIARDEEGFRYLGQEKFHKPVSWKYNNKGHVELWDGLHQNGRPGLIITNWEDIDWFFDYLCVPIEEVHVGDHDVCENPGSWFVNESSIYDDTELLADKKTETSIFEEETIVVQKPKNESVQFEEWFRTFIEEKDLPVVEWNYDKEGYIDIHVDNYDVVELIIDHATDEEKAKIKSTIVKLDFLNQDVNHFLKHLMDGYVEQM